MCLNKFQFTLIEIFFAINIILEGRKLRDQHNYKYSSHYAREATHRICIFFISLLSLQKNTSSEVKFSVWYEQT